MSAVTITQRLMSSTSPVGLKLGVGLALLPNPLFVLLDQIQTAAKSNLHIIAIGMAVALPDICVSLASTDGRSDGVRYKAWCAENLVGEDGAFGFLSPEDLYSFRCGMLHNGRFGGLKHEIDRMVFLLPESGPVMENCFFNGIYAYSVESFCRDICDAVSRWYERNASEPQIKVGMMQMMRYYPKGISGFSGVPIIA